MFRIPRPPKILLVLLALALLPVLVALGLYLYVAPSLPNVTELGEFHLTTPMQVYTSDGHLLAEFGEERRIPVKYDQVPPKLVNAFVAVEDQRFFQHGGVDMLGLLRIAVSNLRNDHAEGASTITMQVARNYYLTRERTLSRKITEIFLALRIESRFDKQAIMEMYLNKIHFSHRAFGVAAAAQTYYGKDLKDLQLHEMAMLAGIPKGESKYNPISNPAKAEERRNHVLKRMLDEKYISKKEYAEAVAIPVKASYHGPRIEFEAPYLTEMVRAEMVARYGEEHAYGDGLKVYTTAPAPIQKAANAALLQALREYDNRHGWRGAEARFSTADLHNRASVISQLERTPWLADLEPAVVVEVAEQAATVLRRDGSTLNIPWEGMSFLRRLINEDRMGAAPKKAGDLLAVGDRIRIEKNDKNQWKLAQVPNVGGAFVSLNPHNGAVLALVGGLDFDISQFNRVTQAKRQPGSNLKPFIYASAFDKGMTTATLINDAPFVDEANGEDDAWRPENDNGKYLGPTRLRLALTRSTNSVTIRLFQALGADYVISFLKRFGFPSDQLPAYPALALGGASELSPMEVVRAYTAIANKGFLITPYFIDKVISNSGEAVFTATPPEFCNECAVGDTPPAGKLPRMLDIRTAFLVTDVMKDVIHRGTAETTLNNNNSPLLKRTDVAGKTGTTNESREAWFSGFNPDIVATAYVGFDDHRKPLGKIEFGGKAALPIWERFMETVLLDMPIVPDVVPDGIVTARIDKTSGLLASASDKEAIYDYFTKETVPTESAKSGNTVEEGEEAPVF